MIELNKIVLKVHKCPLCNYQKKVKMVEEKDGWWYTNNNDIICPTCGVDLKLDER